MAEVVCENGWCEIAPKDVRQAFGLSPNLEGGRKFLQNGGFRFLDTPKNIRAAESFGFCVRRPQKNDAGSDSLSFDVGLYPRPAFHPPLGHFSGSGEWVAHDDFAHQKEAHLKFRDLRGPSGSFVAALFAEMGTGKTKMAIDLVNRHWCLGRIDAVLVLAKKGVHEQWVNDEVEEDGTVKIAPVKAFTQLDIPWKAHAWDGKKLPAWLFSNGPELRWFTINFDAVIYDKARKARKAAEQFLASNNGRVALLGDETHYWKSPSAARTKAARALSKNTPARIIMTGTPLAKNLVDEWSQLQVLDEAILGSRYVTTFRNEFCVMGGFEGRQVVGAKNLDRFKSLTAPFVFRVRKQDCLDLPEKQYRQMSFKLSPEQVTAIQSLKLNQWIDTQCGERVWFEGAAPILGKIQEISNGFLVHPHGIDRFPNPRLELLKELDEELSQKLIVWVRFKEDVRAVCEAFGSRAVAYFGETDDASRREAKARFTDPSSGVDLFVVTTAAAAEGIDGLQKACSTAIYYSNTFNSVQRWQSEDRIHRIGMGDKALYIDLVARGCVDYPLVRNLKQKKDFSTLVLDIATTMGINP